MSLHNMDSTLINLESINTEHLKQILSDYLIDCYIDDDGDIVISKTQKIYLKIDDSENTLRVFSFIRTKEETDNEDLSKWVEVSNKASSTVKYSKMKRSVMAEYGMPQFGHIDHKFLIKLLQHIEDEISSVKDVISDHLEG